MIDKLTLTFSYNWPVLGAGGGSWYSYAYYCPVSHRNYSNATYSYYNVGFRCVRIS